MALYYRDTCIVPDSSGDDQQFDGTSVFDDLSPLNAEPLGEDWVKDSQFFVRYGGQLRAVDFDALALALKGKFDREGWWGSGGGGGGSGLGDMIGFEMSVRESTRALSAYGFPADAQLSIQNMYTSGDRKTQGMLFLVTGYSSSMAPKSGKALQADYWCYKRVNASWTVTGTGGKGLYVRESSMPAATVETGLKYYQYLYGGEHNQYYYKQDSWAFTAPSRGFPQKALQEFDASPYAGVIQTLQYFPYQVRLYSHGKAGTSSKPSTAKPKILYGLWQALRWVADGELKTMDQYRVYTGQDGAQYTLLHENDTFRVTALCQAFASVGASFQGSSGYTPAGQFCNRLKYSDLEASVNHMLVWNRSPGEIPNYTFSTQPVVGGVAGAPFKLSAWKAR